MWRGQLAAIHHDPLDRAFQAREGLGQRVVHVVEVAAVRRGVDATLA
jgi:hypothetical protein